MRNYPLFKNKNKANTPINWQNTYVNSLVMNTKSLVDYSNYFLADYRRGPNFIRIMRPNEETEELEPATYNGLPCYSVENLKYHQYNDTIEEGYYFLNSSDWDLVSDPEIQGGMKIRAGRHIVNNNQKESDFDIYKDWGNMVIQPIGYTGFYLMTYYNGQFVFNYTKNAELYYGKSQSVQPIDFSTRFFYRKNFVSSVTDNPVISVPAEDYHQWNDNNKVWGIQDYNNFIWTDITLNPVMGFLFQKIDNNSIGEEIIVDSKINYMVEVDKTSSAVYTMTAVGETAVGQRFYPNNSVLYFL